jgi:hypothetical protein
MKNGNFLPLQCLKPAKFCRFTMWQLPGSNRVRSQFGKIVYPGDQR